MSSYVKAQLRLLTQENPESALPVKKSSGGLEPLKNDEILLQEESELNQEALEDSPVGEASFVDENTWLLSPAFSPKMNESFLQIAGLTSPVLKETLFYGVLFQWINFNDQDKGSVRQWNMFAGPEYVGNFVEIMHTSPSEGLASYILIKKRAEASTQEGLVNETMSYGDASFYFNHHLKVNTVHLVIRHEDRVYVLEYRKDYHENMIRMIQALLQKSFDSF